MSRNYDPDARADQIRSLTTANHNSYMGGRSVGDLVSATGPVDTVPESVGVMRPVDRSAGKSNNTIDESRDNDPAPVESAQPRGKAPQPTNENFSASVAASRNAKIHFGSRGPVPMQTVDRSNVQGALRSFRQRDRLQREAAGPQHDAATDLLAAGDKCPACRAASGKPESESYPVLPYSS